MVELTVTDSGLGLSAEQMKELFQPFNRLGRDRSSIEGTGIGLAMVRHFVHAHGGEILLVSQPGEGSTFTIVFPGGAAS